MEYKPLVYIIFNVIPRYNFLCLENLNKEILLFIVLEFFFIFNPGYLRSEKFILSN